MVTLSEEQTRVIETLREVPKKNVSVEAVAGAGKTSTLLGIAKAFPEKSILSITYNRALCEETQQRISAQQLHNISMYTLHSFVKNTYSINDYTDRCMHILLDDTHTTIQIQHEYDIIVMDEMQDFNDIMFRTCKKIIKDHVRPPQIVVLGDKRQCIYMDMPERYSDYRFLTYAPSVFAGVSSFPWELCTLQTSYRAHSGISTFMNKVVLREDGHFKSVRDGPKPTYVVAQMYRTKYHSINRNFYAYVDYFVNEIKTHNIRAQDILILAPKVVPNQGKQNNARILADKISQRLNYRVYVNESEYGNFDKELLRDKIWVSTYHGSKGCERPFVIVLDFGSDFFRFYSKGYPPESCPNAMYVALTRSSQHLYLVQNASSNIIQFVDKDLLREHCNIVYTGKLSETKKKGQDKKSPKPESMKPSTIGKYLDIESKTYMKHFYELSEPVRINKVFVKNRQVNKNLGLVADVASYNGHLMTLLFEKYLHGNGGIKSNIKGVKEERLVTSFLREKRSNLIEKDEEYSFEDLVWLCILNDCADNMTQYQVKNMFNINKSWVSNTSYKHLIASYRKWVSRDALQVHFEKPTGVVSMGTFGNDNHPIELGGYVDIVDHDKKRIIEVKYTDGDKADPAHIIQLLTYWYLLCISDKKYQEYTLHLMNFRTGQMHQVTPKNDIHTLLKYIIDRRQAPPLRVSEEEFKKLYF